MGDSDPSRTFGYIARETGRRKLAFLFARETLGPGRIGPELKKTFGGPFIANHGITPADAAALLARGEADAVGFGVLSIANPDLPHRIATGAPLNAPDQATFYTGGAHGYTDYPTSEPTAAVA
jgi:2,4-dienoyl-CoA reductase-like NADH-dependent reductase (Old Yellow Enzyme family)